MTNNAGDAMAGRSANSIMKPKDQFTLDAAVLIGLTFVAAVVVFALGYYFF